MEASRLDRTRFHGKTVLVTGGGRGIGRACSDRFRAEGADVFVAQRNDCPDFPTVTADFADPDAPCRVVDAVIARTGRLDVLVNNAGMMREAAVETMSLEDWDTTMTVNLRAPFLLIKHALPVLRQSRGSIVNIGSIEGLAANSGHAAYCASKAGLHGLTRAVAVDIGADGVRCNAVAPGWIDTELNEDFIAGMPDPEKFRERIALIHPLRRTGTPEDVGALVAWLASEDAGFVTGQVFTVDGGRTVQLPLP